MTNYNSKSKSHLITSVIQTFFASFWGTLTLEKIITQESGKALLFGAVTCLSTGFAYYYHRLSKR